MKKAASFSIKDAFGFGWAMFKEKFGFILGLFLLSGLCMLLPSIAELVTSNRWVLFIAQVAALVISFVIDAGLVYVLLLLRDGKPVKLRDLFAQYPITFRYFTATIAYSMIVGGLAFFFIAYKINAAIGNDFEMVFSLYDAPGLICLIAFGIYIAIRYQFYKYFLVDKQLDIVESFKRSAQVTAPHTGQLFRFGIAFLGISLPGYAGLIVYSYPEVFLLSNLANGIALVISLTLFVTIPVSMLAVTYVYRKLSAPIREEERIEDAEMQASSLEEQEGILDNA